MISFNEYPKKQTVKLNHNLTALGYLPLGDLVYNDETIIVVDSAKVYYFSIWRKGKIKR